MLTVERVVSRRTFSTFTDPFSLFRGDLTSTFNSTSLTSGLLIVGGLLVISFLLYMFDTWATARIDSMLLDYYGPELYSKMTSSYDPEGLAVAMKSINSGRRPRHFK